VKAKLEELENNEGALSMVGTSTVSDGINGVCMPTLPTVPKL